MPTTFGKLNLKDHKEILVLNAPDTFEKEIRGLRDVRVFRRIEDMKALAFALSFVTQRAELHRLSRKLSAKAAGDEAVAGVAIFPNFSAEQRAQGFTDFNDLGAQNPELVSQQLTSTKAFETRLIAHSLAADKDLAISY